MAALEPDFKRTTPVSGSGRSQTVAAIVGQVDYDHLDQEPGAAPALLGLAARCESLAAQFHLFAPEQAAQSFDRDVLTFV